MRRRTRARIFAVAALSTSFVAIFLFALWQSSPAIAGSSAAGSPGGPPGCGTCQEDADNKPHLLAASYYSLGDGMTATLMLNNKGPKPIEVTPTLFSLDGRRLELPPVTVDGSSFRELDMGDFGIAGTPFEEGSLQLFHRGKDLVIGAQVKLVDMQRSLIFEEKLLEVQTEVGQRRLEGVWWLPSPRGEVKLVLSNTGDGPLAVSATVDGSAPKQKDRFTLTLAAHETRVIDALEDVVGKRGGALAEVGGVTLEHTGDAGALLARVLMRDAASGYSLSARFFDPQKAKGTELHGAGLRVGSAGGARLTQIVVARNVGSNATTVTGRLPYTTAGGEKGVLTLPPLKLGPGEAGLVDVRSALRRSGVEAAVASAGLEFEYTNEPGSVIMLAQSVGKGGDHAFTVPMWDIRAQRSSTGGYPWKIEDGATTLAYLKNVTDEPQRYVLAIRFEGGEYTTGLRTVEAGQTEVIDVRALRDSQVADEWGKKIPPDATRGQIQWSIKGPKNLVMVGRSEQVDTARALSMSYACQNCCPDSFSGGWVDPGGGSGFPGDTMQFNAFELTTNCYGSSSPPYGVYPSWDSTNWYACSCNGSGLSTAQAPGTSVIQARWTSYRWGSFESGNPNECYGIEESVLAEAFCEVQACAVPTNFRQVGNATALSNGTLRFNYAWDSSTGNLADLSQCTVGEIVSYPGANPFPWPNPMNRSTPNPTVIDLAATGGGFQDDHQPPNSFSTPYTAASFTATQHYRYRCPCSNGGNYVNLAGPINIVRSVAQNSNGTWRYTVTKSGSSASINPLP